VLDQAEGECPEERDKEEVGHAGRRGKARRRN
jgi:hypothetical protein